MVFAVYGVLANLYSGPEQQLLSVIYLVICAGSLLFLLPVFRRSLFRMNDPLRERRLTGKPLVLCLTRLYIYVILPIFFVAFLQLFSAIGSQFLQFNQSNVQPSPGINDYITPFLAGFEEIWRWSMIGIVVILFRFVLRSWWRWPAVRATVFVVAIVASSIGFGSGHILEFATGRPEALILFSGLGVLLAFIALLTGRILLCICVHISYDLWVTILASVHGHDQVFSVILYIALLLAPMVTALWYKPLYRMTRPLNDDVRLRPYTSDWIRAFDEESNKLRKVFARRRVLYIDHVGSTSILHAEGDDSVDIQVCVRKLKLYRGERRALEKLDYAVFGRVGVKHRIFARKSGCPNVHLHLVEAMGPFAHASFQLRNRLTHDDTLRADWTAAKESYVATGHTGLRAYIEAKRDALVCLIERSYGDE